MTLTLKELRKDLKPLGFKIRTKSLSWGRHLTYVHIESGEELTFNVYSDEQVKRWKPLHDYLSTLKDARLEDNGERIYGSKIGDEHAKQDV